MFIIKICFSKEDDVVRSLAGRIQSIRPPLRPTGLHIAVFTEEIKALHWIKYLYKDRIFYFIDFVDLNDSTD